uniref:Uncharacterized protein n=1 Tax=Schizophyllum commune (strain H4-8 / FGSC 9210) TaxID=578458 RepID=D8PR54_SCHCM
MSSLSGGRASTSSSSHRLSTSRPSTSSLSTSPPHIRTRTASTATTPLETATPIAAGHPVATARAAVRKFATRELGRAELIASLEDYIGNATVDLLLLGAWGLAREVVGGEGIPTSYFARDDRTYRVFCERLDELGIGGEEGVGEGEGEEGDEVKTAPAPRPRPRPTPTLSTLPTPTTTSTNAPNRAAHKLPRKLRWQLRVLRAAVGGRKTTYRTKVELLEAELDGSEPSEAPNAQVCTPSDGRAQRAGTSSMLTNRATKKGKHRLVARATFATLGALFVTSRAWMAFWGFDLSSRSSLMKVLAAPRSYKVPG